MKWIEQWLEDIRLNNLYRERILREGLLDFCSNDYLALRSHPEVIEESVRVLRDYGLGSGASALVSGYTKYHRDLEDKLSEFKSIPCCVLFGSGYLANLGTISALVGEGDLVMSDELNHASIVDACRLSKSKVFVYKHRDYQHLEDLLKTNRKNHKKCLIVTDTVFSMDGDVADIKTLKRLVKEFDCMLYLDEAHATGVLGASGKGGLEEFGENWEEYILVMGTLSKAIGSYGAFVCGSKALCDYLVNRARSLIFSTSLPPAVCAGAKKAIEIIQRENWRVRNLRERSELIYNKLSTLRFEVRFHHTPILPIMVYKEAEALDLRDRLLKQGILIQAIRYPTVPKGMARLRLTTSLGYTKEELERLFKSFEEL